MLYLCFPDSFPRPGAVIGELIGWCKLIMGHVPFPPDDMWHGEGSWVTWVTEGSETTFSNTDRCWVKGESRNSALCCLIIWQATLKNRSSALQQLLFPPWQRPSIWWWRIQYLKGLLVFHSKVSKFVVFCGFFFFFGGGVCINQCAKFQSNHHEAYTTVLFLVWKHLQFLISRASLQSCPLCNRVIPSLSCWLAHELLFICAFSWHFSLFFS